MYRIKFFHPLLKRDLFPAPAECFRAWVSDPMQAERFNSRRAAFARAMSLDANRMLPRGAVPEVVGV